MAGSLFARIFGGDAQVAMMAGTLLMGADVYAWMRRHEEVATEHLAERLLLVVDVQRALDRSGVRATDALAVIEQLHEERKTLSAAEDVAPPPRSDAVKAIAERARRGKGFATTPLVEALADALPRELRFLRDPLRGLAPELGTLFDVPLVRSDGLITLEAWEPGMKTCVEMMQSLANARWKNWMLSPVHLFLAVLVYKPYHKALSARGVDPAAVARGMLSSLPQPTWARARPASLVPKIGPALYALFLRAERYAAEDASDVRLRHALAALHDEDELAPLVEQLAT